MSDPAASTERAPSTTARQWAWRIVRIAVTVLALAWVLSRVDLGALGEALMRVSPLAFALVVAITLLNMGVGTVRWRVLLSAYGAPKLPSLPLLYRLYLIGFFYNVWLPGGVGGDVVRGVASRAAFGPAGATSGVAVVFVERVLGLVGLLLIVGFSSLVHPIEGVDGVLLWSGVGIGAGAGAVLAIAVGRHFAGYAPGPIARILAGLPAIQRWGAFGFALSLSLVTQSLVALSGHVFVAALHPGIATATSFVIVPLAMSTAYLPITAGGAGAREAAFQELYSHVGVSFEDATAASLMLAATYYVVGAIGGALKMPPAEPTDAG